MKKEDVYIPDQSYSSDEIHHGGKWSEEAKQRYREARRAGRSVYDMFSNFYNNANKQITSKANNIANRTIYKKPIVRAKSDYKKAIKRRSAIKRNYDKINAVGSEFVNRGRSPQDKGRRAGIIAKTKSDMRKDYTNSNKTVASKYNSIRKTSNHTLGEIAKDATKAVGKEIGKKYNKITKDASKSINKATKDASKSVNKAIKDAPKKINKFGKEAEKATNKGLKVIDRMIETKTEKKYRQEATKRAEKAAKSADSFIGRLRGKDAVKEYKETYKRELDKRDKSLTVKDIKKSLKKPANKAISSVEKKINKGLRKVDDLYESNDEKLARKIAKQARKDTSKTGAIARTVFSKENKDAVANDIAGAWGKVTGNKELSNRAKQNGKVFKNRLKKKAQAEYKKDQDRRAKKYEDQIYDKQIKLPRIGGKKKKVKHSGLGKVYIPGRTGVSETILHYDTFVK